MKAILPITFSLLWIATVAHGEILGVPGDFDRIEDAVDAAAPGDIVEVASGVYAESIRVRRATNLTIRGIDSGGGAPIVRPGDDDAFRIEESSDVAVSGFRIENCGRGVRVRDESTSVEVSGNEIVGCEVGIRLREGSGHVILDNVIRDSVAGSGVRVREATGVEIDGNTMTNLGDGGIRARLADGIVIVGNVLTDNGDEGVRVRESAGATIGDAELGGNTASRNAKSGIRVKEATQVAIAANVTDDNGRYGIRTKLAAPIDEVADLVAAANDAGCNGIADFRVGAETLTNDCTDGTTTTTSSTSTTSTTTTSSSSTTATSTSTSTSSTSSSSTTSTTLP